MNKNRIPVCQHELDHGLLRKFSQCVRGVFVLFKKLCKRFVKPDCEAVCGYIVLHLYLPQSETWFVGTQLPYV